MMMHMPQHTANNRPAKRVACTQKMDKQNATNKKTANTSAKKNRTSNFNFVGLAG